MLEHGPMQARDLDLGDDWQRSTHGLFVPPSRPRRRYARPVAVDLFAGAGGFSCGIHQAGFHIAAAVESWTTAAWTYMINLADPHVRIHFEADDRQRQFEKEIDPKGRIAAALNGGDVPPNLLDGFAPAGSGWIAKDPEIAHRDGCEHFYVWDCSTITGERILDDLDLEPGELDLVVGGPPCQGFSISGKRNVADPRNNGVFEFARLICEIRPKSFCMENVPGILSMETADGEPVMDAFCRIIEEGDYAPFAATRRALEVSAGVGGAPRKSTRAEQEAARKAREVEEDEGSAQETLFAGEAA
jgi:DNA (cytosine-5)-methyltransferase 1